MSGDLDTHLSQHRASLCIVYYWKRGNPLKAQDIKSKSITDKQIISWDSGNYQNKVNFKSWNFSCSFLINYKS